MTTTVEGTPEATGPATGELKPSLPIKFFYGFGQMVESGYLTVAPFIFFYYTAVLGLSGSLVGLALGISLVLDAVLDPLIGSISDNLRTRLGRRLPMMLLGAPLMGLWLALLFAPPPELSVFLLFTWLTVSKTALRGFASVYNLPYFALGAEMADGYVERSKLVAWRTIAGIMVGVVITFLAYTFFFAGPGGLQKAEGYPAFGWTIGAMSFVGGAICCLGVWRYAAALSQPTTAPARLGRGLVTEIVEVFANRSFRILFASALLTYVAAGLNGTLNSHAYVFVWKLRPETIQLITYAYLLGLAVGVPMTPALLRRVEKRTAVILGVGVILATWTLLPGARAAGLFAPVGEDALAWLSASVFVAGVGTGFIAIAYPAMMADAADEHEVLFGARREGMYFAGLGFASKAAAGLGQLLGGVAIDILRFPKEAGRQVDAAVPEGVLRDLAFAWGPVPALMGVVAAALLIPYAISRARHEEIAAQLRAKRARDVAEGRSS